VSTRARRGVRAHVNRARVTVVASGAEVDLLVNAAQVIDVRVVGAPSSARARQWSPNKCCGEQHGDRHSWAGVKEQSPQNSSFCGDPGTRDACHNPGFSTFVSFQISTGNNPRQAWPEWEIY
jgi:hypothetical protein